MNWDRLLGKGAGGRIVKHQLQAGNLSHAYLFMGPHMGKNRQTAIVLAQAINCQADSKPCGSCLSCRQIHSEVHADVRLVEADGRHIKREQIKTILTEAVLMPNVGPYKIFIIHGAHALTAEAANVLLTTLEEPPAYAVFILTAQAPVLPTIASRCQVFNLPQNVKDMDDAAAQVAAYGEARQLLRDLLSEDIYGRFKRAEKLSKAEIDLGALILALLHLYRDLNLWQATQDWRLIRDREAVESLFPLISEPGRLLRGSHALVDALRQLGSNVNKRLTLEYLFYNL